jgi:hypothetical protein
MEDVVIPFQISKGMVVFGSFTGESEMDLYVWIRRFESEGQRKELYKAVYESEKWLNEIKPIIDTMLDRSRIVVSRIVPTAKSVMH